MGKKNSRFIAIKTLHSINRLDTPLPVLFQQICRQYQIEGSDRALAMTIVYGVLRRRDYLEAVMAQLCHQPLAKLHPLVYCGLAVGLFQLLFLERIPESAAVNETVDGIKAAKLPKRLHGFVNGVLRQAIRGREQLPHPDDTDSEGLPYLNHPDWLTSRWSANFGREEMVAICRRNNEQQPLALRLDTSRIGLKQYLRHCAEQGLEARAGRFAPEAVILSDYQGPIASLPGYNDQLFQVQGEAAQLATLLLAPFKDRGHYLDGCAGLGGKTGHILRLLAPHDARLTAVEPDRHRYATLEKSFTRAQNEGFLTLVHADLQEFGQSTCQLFDGILLDVPCSGTGVTGKHPDIRWRRRPEDIGRYAERQLELLETAGGLAGTGGVLVYATCSIEPEENLGVLRTFLQANPSFRLEDSASHLPTAAASLIRNQCLQPRPSEDLEGFFAARLVRTKGDD